MYIDTLSVRYTLCYHMYGGSHREGYMCLYTLSQLGVERREEWIVSRVGHGHTVQSSR